MICPGCGCFFCDDTGDYPPETATPRKYCSQSCKRSRESGKLRNAIRLKVCAEREKVPYACMEDARDAAGWLLLRQGVVTYPYLCPCGQWHLSKQLPGTWPEWETA